MAYSVLRHRAYDDTWAWVFAFGFAMLGTLAATSYLTVVLVKSFWRLIVDGMDIDSRVFYVSWPIYFGVVTIVVIFTATIWFYSSLERRRRSVERLLVELGCSRVSADWDDPRTRRLLNIHDEVAIACGLEPPAIYLMQGEASINAFTAGTTPDDTAICITYGALRTLKRAELQAVIAHEYGHILNGDVRRNTRLLFFLGALIPYESGKAGSTYLAFLKVIGIVALIGLPFSLFGHGSTVFGMCVLLSLLATLIWLPTKAVTLLWSFGAGVVRATQAAVSRRRELAADAASTQFTRDPEALASVLRKVAGLDDLRKLETDQARSVAHMCFAPALGGRNTGLFAAHPPMEERLRQLGFPADARELRTLNATRERLREQYVTEVDGELAIMLLNDHGAAAVAPAPMAAIVAKTVAASAAFAAAPDLAHAARLLGRIPDELRAELRRPAGACAAAHALLGAAPVHGKATGLEAAFAKALEALDDVHRLPLVELAIPTLRAMPHEEQRALDASLRTRMNADSHVSLREAVFFSLLSATLRAGSPAPSPMHAGDAFATVIGAAAHASAGSTEAARDAFEAGRERTFPRAVGLPPGKAPDFAQLEEAFATLGLLPVNRRRVVLGAVARVIGHDGKMSVAELELLRAVGAALHFPLAPVAPAM